MKPISAQLHWRRSPGKARLAGMLTLHQAPASDPRGTSSASPGAAAQACRLPPPGAPRGEAGRKGKAEKGEAPEPKRQAWGENRARPPQPRSTEPEEPVVACCMLQSVGSWLLWGTGAEQMPRCKHQPALCMWKRLSWPLCYLGQTAGTEGERETQV